MAMVQMPAGIPVATMAIGKAGARNAGLFAVQVLATTDATLAKRLEAYKAELVVGVEAKAKSLEERLRKEGF